MSLGVAIVTGAAQGLGKAIALRLAKDGYDIALNDLPSQSEDLAAVKAEIEKSGRRAHVVTGDVSKEEDVKRSVEETVEVLGGLDAVRLSSFFEIAN